MRKTSSRWKTKPTKNCQPLILALRFLLSLTYEKWSTLFVYISGSHGWACVRIWTAVWAVGIWMIMKKAFNPHVYTITISTFLFIFILSKLKRLFFHGSLNFIWPPKQTIKVRKTAPSCWGVCFISGGIFKTIKCCYMLRHIERCRCSDTALVNSS